MIRFLMNALGSVLLVAGIMLAVADTARSLADDAIRMMTLGEAFAAVGISPAMSSAASSAASTDATLDGLVLVSGWPAAVALTTGGFLFLFLGRSRPASDRRFAR